MIWNIVELISHVDPFVESPNPESLSTLKSQTLKQAKVRFQHITTSRLESRAEREGVAFS